MKKDPITIVNEKKLQNLLAKKEEKLNKIGQGCPQTKIKEEYKNEN